jgi:hypothetical protein
MQRMQNLAALLAAFRGVSDGIRTRDRRDHNPSNSVPLGADGA